MFIKLHEHPRASENDPQRILESVFGYREFRGQQKLVIEQLLSGGDALVLMPTGGGKSLCYQIPAIAHEGVGIVVSPLIALMQDQVSALTELGVAAAFVNSTLPYETARRIEDEMVHGGYDLVYVAPERLTTPGFLSLLERTKLALFAIDEAHCVSQWGHDFRPEYRKLDVLHERFPAVPRIALTATADEPTRREIVEHLHLGGARRFVSGFDRPNIRYDVVPKKNAKAQLLRFIRFRHAGQPGIVYCMSRKKVDDVAAWLRSEGIAALAYHAGLDKTVRQRHQERFLEEEGVVIVGTIAFGLGIDKPDVRFVAHLDLPKSLEAYYQETGRAGRDGLPSEAWMCYGYGDAVLIRQLVERSESSAERKRVEHMKLGALLGYCETAECRRAVMLRYFGEERDEGCGNCDTCLEPVDAYDGTVVAQKALSNVYRTGQMFGAGYLADVLIGASSERVVRNRHDRATTFGIGAELDRAGWMGVYRQLVASGLVDVDPEHGGLRLSDRAWPVLKGERALKLRRDRKRLPAEPRLHRTTEEEVAGAADRKLFDALRAKRLEIAQARSLPAYVIFHDKTLAEMARIRPRTLADLSSISGVGQKKLETYGQTFLDVLRAEGRSPGADEGVIDDP
ncbi:MAG TPA: DNA helicase RecQ [Vicinamibacteria bacterium]|nr:DNA helicase RecQ [Vicinamibacteria bacterium]